MIYAGYWDSRLQSVWDVFPEWRRLSEPELTEKSKVLAALDGTARVWVNSAVLLTVVDADDVMVVTRSGEWKRLSQHYRWKSWSGYIDSGECLTIVGADW